MLSVQASSYGVSALDARLTPASAKNGDTGQTQATARLTQNGKAEGSGPPVATATELDVDSGGTLALFEAEDWYEAGAASGDFEAAARFLLDVIDLREVDEEDTPPDSAVKFDEAGTYRPAWSR